MADPAVPSTDREETLTFFTDSSYNGFGLSEGLSRGVQVLYEGQSLTQEGMGIGAVALKRGGLTYFCRQSAPAPEGLGYTCILDTVLLSEIMRTSSRLLSHLWHGGTALYRHLPQIQPLLLVWAASLRRWLRIKNRFEAVESQGTAAFSITEKGWGLDVRCTVRVPDKESKICIMNEMGADWFTGGWSGNTPREAPPPWQKLSAAAAFPSLYSERLGLLFSLKELKVSGSDSYTVFWGRERNEDLCWAGYTIEIDLGQSAAAEVLCSYRVEFEKLKKEG